MAVRAVQGEQGRIRTGRIGAQASTGILPVFDADLTQGPLSPQLTPSGGANGTRTNSSGFIVPASAPRLDYDPVALAVRGVLLEEQRADAAVGSQDFISGWSNLGSAVIAAAAATSPDGTTNASRLGSAHSSGVFGVYQQLTYTAATYTFSIFAKAGTYNYLVLDFNNSATAGAVFNLSNGTVGYTDTGVTASAQSVGNGWYRLVATMSRSSGISYPELYLSGSATANTRVWPAAGTENVYLYGSQVEIGSFPTSYIPTTTAAVTRSADVLTAGSGLAAMLAAGPCILESTSILTGVTTKVAYAAGAFTWPINVWVRHLTVYPAGTSMAYVNSLLSVDLVWGSVAAYNLSAKSTAEALTTIAANSVSGVDTNSGSLASPKRTLAGVGTVAANGVVGLYRSSFWRESISLASLAGGISIQDIAGGTYTTPFPVLTAFDVVPNGSWTSNGNGTYTYTWTAAESLIDDGYHNVYVSEINASTEGATPLAARARLQPAVDAPTAVATAGTAFIESLGSNQWRATINPTDGHAPGTLYRYEVTSRIQPIQWNNIAAGGSLTGVNLIGGNHGYGSLGGPLSFTGDRFIVQLATTHGAVVGSGNITRALFSGRGDSDSIGLAFYTNDPASTSSTFSLTKSFFYNFLSAFISHSGGTSYVSGLVEDTIFVAQRLGGALISKCIGIVNNTALTINRCYFDGSAFPISFDSTVGSSTVTNSIFRRCGQIWPSKVFQNNIVQVENISDPNNVGNRNATAVKQRGIPITAIKNNLFYAKVQDNGNGISDLVAGGFDMRTIANTGAVQQNIVILQSGSGQDAVYMTLGSGPYGMTADYNLVILVSGNFRASTATTQTTWAAYKTATGLDTNSLYLDLPALGLALNDVFKDAANGDFRFADTATGNTANTFCTTNNVGPAHMISHWPGIPTIDSVAVALAATTS